MNLQECLTHIPVQLTPEMEQYATDVVLVKSRYIFTRRQGRQQYGYCTHCNQEFPTASLRHNAKALCSGCGSECIVKAAGRSRNNLTDEAYFTYWLKSAVDPKAIVAIGTHAVRDYSGGYKNVETHYAAQTLYVFRTGKGGSMFRRWTYFRHDTKTIYAAGFLPQKAVTCQWSREHNANLSVVVGYSRQSLANAVSGTPFQYSTWEQFDYGDMTDFMELFARWPSIEYLVKFGLDRLVRAKLAGERTYSAVNWRGNSLPRVLRLTPQQLHEIKAAGIVVDFPLLRIMQASRKDGSHFTPAEADDIVKSFDIEILLNLRGYASLRRITSYLYRITAQQGCMQAQNPYRTPYAALRAWRDYVRDCEILDQDLTAERVIFPKNLYFSHQNTIARIQERGQMQRAQINTQQNMQIEKQARKLAKLHFQTTDFLIRPIASLDELRNEGKVLQHCVSRYAEQYAAGKTALLVLRKNSDADRPFFTIEVFQGRITQCYGLRNCLPPEEVKAFVAQFKSTKLSAKEEQEVAN